MKTQKEIIEKEIKDLFYNDLKNHSIKFANWIAKNNYEKMFIGKRCWITWNEVTNFEDYNAPRYTTNDIYNKFMIDYLC